MLGDVQVLALTDRVWQAGEAFARAATLVEEAAVEAGRRALGRLASPGSARSGSGERDEACGDRSRR